MDDKVAHLQMIQAVITRMASNSFLLKGWSVTLVAALTALAANDARLGLVFLAYLPVIAFWVLDGYFLHQERLFRALYDSVCDCDKDKIDFKMKTTATDKTGSWPSAIVSSTLLAFYVTLAVAILIAVLVVLAHPHASACAHR